MDLRRRHVRRPDVRRLDVRRLDAPRPAATWTRADVDVWELPAGAEPSAADLARLDAGERRRAAELPAGRGPGFVLGRSLLRGVLGKVTGTAPDAVRLDATCACGLDHGRVTVPGARTAGRGRSGGPVHVSITRSGPRVLVALARRPVGVDLVAVADVAAAPLAGVLPDAVAPSPGAAPGTRSDAERARTWARVEATLKAHGAGLRTDPRDVRLRGATARLGHARLRVADVPAGPGEAAAVALAGVVGPWRRRPLRVAVHDGRPLLA